MKQWKENDKDIIALLIVAAGITAVVASVILTITNKLRQRRLLCRLSQCVDSIQRAMPSIEHASRIYVDRNDPNANEDMPF